MNSTQDFIYLNIALIPPAELFTQACEASQKFSQRYQTYFQLDNVEFFPHLTVYMTEFPAARVTDIQAKLKTLTANLSEIVSSFSHSFTTEAILISNS